jgi:Phasin protein
LAKVKLSREQEYDREERKRFGGQIMADAVFWERTKAATALQKEFLHAYEKASHAWVARVQSEVAMSSDLATKLAAARTAPEALEAYSKCVSQRMHVAAEDGRRLFDEGQQVTQKINRSLTIGWPTRSP